MTVATSVSFWFNAGFAKHYTLSAALVARGGPGGEVGARRGLWRLVVAAVVVGLGTGASWELTAIMAVGLVALVVFGTRRITLREAATAAAVAIVVSAALLTFVVVRAPGSRDRLRAAHHCRPVGRPRPPKGLPHRVGGAERRAALSKAPSRTIAYGRITVQEVGAATVALALIGAVVVFRRRHRGDTLFLGLVLVGNVVGAVFVAGLEHDRGITSGMVVGGFLIDLVLVIGVLVAVGTTALGDAAGRVGRFPAPRLAPRHARARRAAGRGRVRRRRRGRRPVARRARALRDASRTGACRPLRAAGALRAGAERRLVDVRLGVRPADPLPPDRVR